MAPPMDRFKGNLEETLIFHRKNMKKQWFLVDLVDFPFNQSIQTRPYSENHPIFADHFYLRTSRRSTDGITPKRCRTNIPFTTTLRLDEGGCYKECPGFFPFLSAKTTILCWFSIHHGYIMLHPMIVSDETSNNP